MRTATWLALVVVGSTACLVVDRRAELCNGVDDDGDPDTEDGIGEPGFGEACDGPDADLCAEGSMVCIDGVMSCNDATGDDTELCNGLDDDCDGTIDEGYDLATDPGNCGRCGRACTNANGPTACAAGGCAPTCEPGAVDCNGDPVDGCEVFRDRNPTCGELAGVSSLAGDRAGAPIVFHGTDEAIFEVTLEEVATTTTAITGTFALEVPPGVDFDLNVYCGACGGATMGSSRRGPGIAEEVLFRHRDTSNVNDDQPLFVEIRFAGAATCAGEWRLTITGGTAVPTVTCGPI